MYANFIDPQIQILERCQASWASVVTNLPDDLSPYGVPGLTRSEITKSFPLIISRLKSIKAQSKDDVSPFIIQTLSQNFPSWTTPLEGWIVSAPSTVPNIFSHLNAMWSQLNAFDIESKIPSLEEVKKIIAENKRLQSEVQDLFKATANLTKKKNDLTEALAQAKKLTKDSKDLLDDANKAKASIDADAAVTGAHRESIERDQLDAKKHLDMLAVFTEKMPEFDAKKEAITKQCDDILLEATSRLDAASRAGMATSFSDRAKDYIWPRRGWLVSFFLSLTGVFVMACFFVIPEIKDLSGIDRLFHFITDIPLTLPFIWFAWFSALRFSQLGRLNEDYAFKVATALSLDGYRKQAHEVRPELQEKLLDLAITNFGENPLRLMTKESAKDAHPLAGTLDEKTINEILKSAFKALSDKANK